MKDTWSGNKRKSVRFIENNIPMPSRKLRSVKEVALYFYWIVLEPNRSLTEKKASEMK